MADKVQIAQDTWWVGANDYDTHRFEAIWPLPGGISYNSFLIKDEKTALIDAVKGAFLPGLLERIKALLGERPLDYVVVNHMVPDHSGALAVIRESFPDVVIVGNKKTANLLEAFFGITQRLKIVDDNEALNLGRHNLRFFLTPMVHWPETMMTFDELSGVLFSGDAFGGFGAVADGIFDDQVETSYFEREILRYFSNIIAKYGDFVNKAIVRVSQLPIKVVASTHGPIWRDRPGDIIDHYARWSRQETEPQLAVIYASMYGNTRRLAEAVASAASREGVKTVRVMDVSRMEPSFIISDMWTCRGLVLASPTYNTRLFPLMASMVDMLQNMKLKNRFLGLAGTYGWSKGALAALLEFAKITKLPLVAPTIEAHCAPTRQDLDQCDQLGREMARALTQPPNR